MPTSFRRTAFATATTLAISAAIGLVLQSAFAVPPTVHPTSRGGVTPFLSREDRKNSTGPNSSSNPNSSAGENSSGSSSLSPSYPYTAHWKQGAIYVTGGHGFLATEVQTTITTPEDYPDPSGHDDIFVGLSAWDDGVSYDQVGFYDGTHGWQLLYSWSQGCSSQNYHTTIFNAPWGALTANTQYTFAMYSFRNGTIEMAASLGTTMSFVFWNGYFATGGNLIDLADHFTCTSGLNQYTYDDYTDYEEVGTTGVMPATTGEDVPNWDFTFTGNSWVLYSGCACGVWTPYSTPGGPSYVSTTISGSGSVIVNEESNLTIGTTLGSGVLASVAAKPGGTVTLNGQSYGTCCSGGGTASLSMIKLPSGWKATFTPNPLTTPKAFSLSLKVPASAAYGLYSLRVNLSWTGGLWTSARFLLTLSVTGSGGGGGCIAWNTTLQTSTGPRLVQDLSVGTILNAYYLSNNTEVNRALLWANFSWAPLVISINGGQLYVTNMQQPLYVKNGTWIGAVNDPQNLTVGEYLFSPATNSWVEITSLSTISQLTPVFDVVVASPFDFGAGAALAFVKDHGGGI